MKTDVVVNVKMTVCVETNTRLNPALTEAYVEKLARDKVVDIICCAENKISIENINAIIKVEKDD